MTIREVEEKLKISRANVRYYEKEGLLVTKRNPVNGYREYSQENVNNLQKIVFLRSLDVSIADLRMVMRQEVALSEIIEKQMNILKSQQQAVVNAIAVCQEIKDEDKVTIDAIQVDRYAINEEKKNNYMIKDSLSILALIPFSWQIYIILFQSGITFSIDALLRGEMILFAMIFFSAVLYQKRKRSAC